MAKRFNNSEEAMQYLQTLPFNTLLQVAADAIVACQNAPQFKKITLTQEQFEAHFRIAGTTEDGGVETRGRKRKTE